jgi:hypothetical protein
LSKDRVSGATPAPSLNPDNLPSAKALKECADDYRRPFSNWVSGELLPFLLSRPDLVPAGFGITTPPLQQEQPGAGASKLRPPAAQVENAKDQLLARFGKSGITRMVTSVSLRHIQHRQPRAASIQTVFKALLSAELIQEDQRASIVTLLNRMKKDTKLVHWEGRENGRGISLTSEGTSYLAELSARLLLEDEIEYLKTHAPELTAGWLA